MPPAAFPHGTMSGLLDTKHEALFGSDAAMLSRVCSACLEVSAGYILLEIELLVQVFRRRDDSILANRLRSSCMAPRLVATVLWRFLFATHPDHSTADLDLDLDLDFALSCKHIRLPLCFPFSLAVLCSRVSLGVDEDGDATPTWPRT